jgi:putative methyltransferase (TIGR01177 family)
LEINPPLDFHVLDVSAFKNVSGEVLSVTETSSLTTQALESVLEQVDWKSLSTSKKGGSWSVRAKGDREFFRPKELKDAELTLADKIYKLWDLPVKLSGAKVQFQLIVDKASSGATVLCFGILRYKQSQEIKQRLSRTLALRRPYFSIGTMNNPIARVVANFSETPPGTIILDPFCGSGGILIEGALNGNLCLGIDVDRMVIRGARKNLKYFAPDMRLGEIRASALALPLRSSMASLGNQIVGVSTDLPYGRSSSTQGLDVTTIWGGFLNELCTIMKPGSKCCMVVPDTPAVLAFLARVRQDARFQVIETCNQMVHNSLTRRFIVLQVL